MSDLNQIKVSMFKNVFTKVVTSEVPISKILENIQSGRYKDRILSLRELRASDEERYDKEKCKLPAFTMSGTFNGRTELIQHSNLIQVDLDDLGDKLSQLRERLKADPHVVFGFVSPSGDGLKLGFMMDGPRHAECCRAAEVYFQNNYGIEVDPQCKDINRLCLVSYDPELWSRDGAVPLPINTTKTGFQSEREKEEGYSSESCMLNNYNPTSLNSCIPTSLYNVSEGIVANAKARNEAQKTLSRENPMLAKLFKEFIESRFQAQAHRRNDFIVNAVPFLFRAVAEHFVVLLVVHFYDCNQALFRVTREQHANEAEAMLRSVRKTYLEGLSEHERALYDSLADNRERDAFRICRDLALYRDPEFPQPLFYLSYAQLGRRLGIHDAQAQEVMRQLVGLGVLQKEKNGKRWAPGVRPEASIYRWLMWLPSPVSNN